MRTLVFTAALLLISAAASAGPSREIVLAAASDSPNAVAVEQPKVAHPVPQAASPAAGQPVAEKAAVADKPVARKRETDEAKARRIAARYGISW